MNARQGGDEPGRAAGRGHARDGARQRTAGATDAAAAATAPTTSATSAATSAADGVAAASGADGARACQVVVSDSVIEGAGGYGPTDVLGPGVGHLQAPPPPYCASLGLALALRDAGLDAAAERLERGAPAILASSSQAAAVQELLQSTGQFRPLKVLANFQPLVDVSEHPTLLQLRASDGDNTHFVAVRGRWLFDANHPEPRPLTAAGLDACCLGDATYARASHAVRFVPSNKASKAAAKSKKAKHGPS